jgi:RNA polymerase sigma-70 factor (ECF subfamily)
MRRDQTFLRATTLSDAVTNTCRHARESFVRQPLRLSGRPGDETSDGPDLLRDDVAMPTMTLDALLTLERAERDEPALSPGVREHLGTQLRALYGSLDALIAPASLNALMERLDAALAAHGEALTAEVRAGMAREMPGLMRYALSLTRNPTRAEDVLQEAMMKAWRSRHTFEVGTNLTGWLTMIVRNTFYTSHRRRSHEVEDPDDMQAARLSVAPAQEDGLHLQDVQGALGQLSPEQREALVLVVLNNLSYEEAAVAMGCRIGTVKSRLFRARERLAEIVG